MTINDTWGYKSYDTNFKSTETLLRNLIDIASKGGNYLLNIGPDSHGIVPQPEVDRLHAMGAWLAVNGEAIYGTTPTLFGAEADSFSATEKDRRGNPLWVPAWTWRSTTRPDKIYIEIFNWPKDGKFELHNLPRNITRAYLLVDPAHRSLPFGPAEQQGSPGPVTNPVVVLPAGSVASAAVPAGRAILIQLPATAPDPIATVVVLETAR
jgi:alpha-L-fucosidase